MGIRGGSKGDPAVKLGDPTKNAEQKKYKMRGSNETTYPLYNTIEETEDLRHTSGLI